MTDELTHIRDFARKIAFPATALDEVLPVCERLLTAYPGETEHIRSLAAPTSDPDAADREINGIMKTVAAERELPIELLMLAAVLILGNNAETLYRRLGKTEKIYLDSMRDITLWTESCIRETGNVGIYDFFDFLWLMDSIRADVIRLHRLQFKQVFYDSTDVWQKGGLTVRRGDRVLFVHIPGGEPLLHEDVIESYRQAYRNFGMRGTAAFHCSTWLLYPGLLEFLPGTSNIRRFAEDYEIVDVDHERNCQDLWRVFGRRTDYVPAELPRKTSLQRGLADYLAAHDNVTGCGYGMLAFDGENVLR